MNSKLASPLPTKRQLVRSLRPPALVVAQASEPGDEQFDAVLPLKYNVAFRTAIFQVPAVSLSYKISESQISHNRFDDEIIAVNLATGTYFSFHNTAAELWSLLERGPATADSLTAAFADAPVCASQEISIFLQRLHYDGLLTNCLEEPVQSTSVQAFSTPVVEEFDELRELLLADIVHDTDEAGWPYLIKT
jgi:hypothetical protein